MKCYLTTFIKHCLHSEHPLVLSHTMLLENTIIKVTSITVFGYQKISNGMCILETYLLYLRVSSQHVLERNKL